MEVEAFDWREYGILTSVRDQGHCNCCWAITAAAAIESLYNIKIRKKNQNLVQAAPQQLVDCVQPNPPKDKTDDKGCYLLSINKAFKWVMDNKGIAREKDYPFMGEKGDCKQMEKSLPVMKIESYKKIYDIDILYSKIQEQPIAGAIRMTLKLRRLKNNEIYEGPANTDELLEKYLHAVLIVGFGKANDGKKYWIIKNSWGEDWSDNGYGKISQKSINTKEGPKYLLERISYPTIKERQA